MGLHKKLILFSVLCVGAAITFLSWQATETLKDQIKADQKERVDLLAEVIGNGLKTSMLEGKGREFQKFLDTFVAEDIAVVRIRTRDGVILSSSVPGEIGSRLSDLTGRGRGAVMPGGGSDGREVYSESIVIKNDQLCRRCHGDQEPTNGVLDVVLYTRHMDRELAESSGKMRLVGLAAIAFFIVAMSLLSFRQVKSPLGEMTHFLKKVQEGDLNAKIPGGGNAEMRQLAERLDRIVSELRRCRQEVDNCMMDKNVYSERMASLGELATSVAHDIKNPLAGISGALQVLAEDFPEESSRKEIAGEILSEIGRLDAAVKDLLIYARPPELNLILTDINAIIEKVRYGIEREASAIGVNITSESGTHSEILADPDQLERAIMNMAVYCLHALQAAGTLAFAARDNSDTEEVEITIAGTGNGVRNRPTTDLFKPSFSMKHPGTGLGLAISRSVIESHKGRIETESVPGASMSFRIFLRRKK
jgi:signal transduction histidine kinase